MVIFRFFKMAAAVILNFKKFKFLTADTVKRVKLYYCAIFRQNRSNRGRDMVFLVFQDIEFLTVGRVASDELRQYAKFRQNRSKCGRDM